jgi:hypothetical protein
MAAFHQGLTRVFLAFKQNFILTLYLWGVFLLLVVFKSTILAEQHIDFVYHGAALINALAFSKVILLARRFDVSARIKDAPLIYPTLLKSAFFTVVLACFKILDDAAVGFHRHQSFRQSISGLGGGTWHGVLSLMLLVFAVLIPFVGIEELGRVIGEGKLKKLFFQRQPLERETS